MAKGDIVLARAFKGEPLVRVIWEENKSGALICRKEQFVRWEKGGEEPLVTGFPKEAIFKYDDELVTQLQAACRSSAEGGSGKSDSAPLDELWDKAEPFF